MNNHPAPQPQNNPVTPQPQAAPAPTCSLPNKFTLTRPDNLFLAKKYLKDSVYRSAFLEGIAVTFPQTEAILENATVQGVPPKDIAKVFGLRDGWEYILNNLDQPLNLKFLEDLHQIVAREDVPWQYLGALRTQQVRISGTGYLPPLPQAEKLHRYLLHLQHSLSLSETPTPVNIPQSETPTTPQSETPAVSPEKPSASPHPAPSATDLALTTLCHLCRTQPFLDGNKRVATLVCNKILISTGHGLFSLPPDLKEPFTTLLVQYYESGDPTQLKDFIYNSCLTGLS